MPTFLFLAAICLLVIASILLETGASPPPKTNTKLEKEPSISDNAESTPGQHPENPWAALHKGLKFFGPGGLIVQHNGKENGHRSARAKQSIPSGIFYYEVTILEQKNGIFIGLATEQMPVDEWVGESEGTYAYASWGDFWGHEVDYSRKRLPLGGRPKFKEGDVIGCGVDWATGQIIYTRNKELLKTSGLKVDSAAELFPAVSMFKRGTTIKANFGPEFEFKIAEAFSFDPNFEFTLPKAFEN